MYLCVLAGAVRQFSNTGASTSTGTSTSSGVTMISGDKVTDITGSSKIVAKDGNSEVSHIYSMFPTVPQVALKFLFDISNSDMEKVTNCVLQGPTLEGIRHHEIFLAIADLFMYFTACITMY